MPSASGHCRMTSDQETGKKHLSSLATVFPGNVVIGKLLIAEIIGRPKGPVCYH